MSVEQIKQEINVLSADEQNEVSAFLFHLRHRIDPAYQQEMDARANDSNSAHWLTPDEFERRMDQR